MDLSVKIPARTFRTAAAALMLCVCAGTVCGAHAGTTKQKKESKRAESRTIESMEADWQKAMVQGDTASLDKLLGDDFLAISANGTLSDKTQYLHRLSTHANVFQAIDVTDSKMRMQPTSAVVISQAHVVGQLDGRPIDGIYRYTKVYGRAPGGQWHVLNFEATRVSDTRMGDFDMHRGMPLSQAPRFR